MSSEMLFLRAEKGGPWGDKKAKKKPVSCLTDWLYAIAWIFCQHPLRA